MSRNTRYAAIAGLVIVVLILVGLQIAVSMGDTTWGEIWGLALFALFMGLAVAGYFLPSIIAGRRKHHNLGAIIAVNLLLGWSLIGWIVALVWSLTDPSPTVRLQQPVQQWAGAPAVQYQVGDVVNGHRFNGQTWEPLQ